MSAKPGALQCCPSVAVGVEAKEYHGSGDDSFKTIWDFDSSTVDITAVYIVEEFPYIAQYVTARDSRRGKESFKDWRQRLTWTIRVHEGLFVGLSYTEYMEDYRMAYMEATLETL
ncbi:hypothetical protein FOZ60_003755 [Perkinsus olseni]|uniref:Uncharacterized protein n=1 Tax=Perkinsus olseni TaxID=32597 RepID=A0A7J6NX01_PEROL|nr:hypothetical protein FOZ60_003755 [Perkinsus olseni]